MHPLYTKSSYPVQTRSSMDCEVHSEDEKKKGRLYCNLFLGSTCTIGRFGYSDPKNLSIHNYLFHIDRVITLRELCVLLRKPLGEHTKPKCRLATFTLFDVSRSNLSIIYYGFIVSVSYAN